MTPDIIAKLDPATADAMRAFEDKLSVRSDFAGLILFGSRARNTHRADSDADVVVLLSGSPGKFIAYSLCRYGRLNGISRKIILIRGF